jgi:N-acetylneuraminate synthase/sialic acid synthase
VKLQKRDNRALYTQELYNKPYEHENSFGATYGAHREALEFGHQAYIELKTYAKELGVDMFATAFDIPSAAFLADLDMPAYKIASGDLRNTPLLRYVAKFGKPVILSTGGGSLEDVRRAYDAIVSVNPRLAILQCTSAYPAEHADLNLRVIETYRREFPETVIGFSDHENGIAMATAAYMLGARIVEQHFTVNHTWKGTDQVFSLEPIGMRKLVRDLRRVRQALGDGVKRPLPCEADAMTKMGKKLVAARDLSAGHTLLETDLAIKSPGNGLPPYEIDKLVGKRLLRPLPEDSAITFGDVS